MRSRSIICIDIKTMGSGHFDMSIKLVASTSVKRLNDDRSLSSVHYNAFKSHF